MKTTRTQNPVITVLIAAMATTISLALPVE
jgi:hypothetical protein